MTLDETAILVRECHYPDYDFFVTVDGRGAWYLQANYYEPDIITKQREKQSTRRWFLSPEMTKSEVVQTAFKCIVTSMEHRSREGFTYKNKRIFGPHFDVDALWSICNKLDYREPS